MRALKIAGASFALALSLAGVVAIRYGVFTKVQYIGNNRSQAFFYLLQKIRKDGILNTIQQVQDKLGNDPRLGLGYSLYDRAAYPPVESAAARDALPEYKTLPAANIDALASHQPARRYDTWYRSNGDDSSSKYSDLDQIDSRNLQDLAVAWKYTYASPKAVKESVPVESNPIVVNRRVFIATIDSHLLCLDATTGRELWRVDLPSPAARRGVVWEPNPDFASSRLFVPTATGVYALNAATGEILRNFGSNGEVGDELSVIAPVIAGDKLVVAIIKPAVEAYDRRTGKFLWTTPLLETPQGDRALLTGGSPWAGMSYDAARSRVFVSTGNPRPESWGVSRPGANQHSSSIVALDADSGRIAWSFQEVAHDLWDLDVPSPPVLTTITRNGRKVDVVAAATKMGNTLLLDRDHGQPIFDYRLRKVPVSRVPGEQTWPYQPDLELPEPFLRVEFDPSSDVTDVSESSRANITQKIRSATFGFFVPPVLGGSVVMFGVGGGALWPGAAVDQRNGTLFVPSIREPWMVRAGYRDLRGTERSVTALPGNGPYQSLCAQCHGPARDGAEQPGTGIYAPALTGITILRSKEELTSKTRFAERHAGLKVDVSAADPELEPLFDYFARLDKIADDDKAFAVRTAWIRLHDDKGYPGSKPPWGLLTAINLNTGRKTWQVPFGEYANLLRNRKPVQGQVNTGGAIATAGGVVFATGTLDHRVRAFDSATGKELWTFTLAAAGSAPPATYMIDGRQYLVVVASDESHDEVVAFSLSPRRGQLQQPWPRLRYEAARLAGLR